MDDISTLSGAKLGNFRLERLIGRGRMGVVYLARDEALLRPTAVKILSWQSNGYNGEDPEAWFLAEARSVARINHPNVVQIYSVARHGTYCYIAMEFITGGSTHVVIEKSGPFSPERATEILIQTAGALQAAHDAGIVHRDVKPENLLVGADGVAKLGDFGMALHVSKPRRTEPARAGTPFYTAPEIWSGSGATPKTDLYALGATYYYLLTGRVPYPAKDLPTLISAHLRAPVPEASVFDLRIPKGCDLIIQQCLAKSGRERFADARELGLAAKDLFLSLVPARPNKRQSSSPPANLETRRRVSSESAAPITNDLRKPLVHVETSFPAHTDEPISRQQAMLVNWLELGPAGTLVLLGESGSGRTTMAQQLMSQQFDKSLSLYFDGATLNAHGSLGDQIETTLGMPKLNAPDCRGNARVLLDWIMQIRGSINKRVLLVLDANIDLVGMFSDLNIVTRESSPYERWKLLVIDSSEKREQWTGIARAPDVGIVAIREVPRLTMHQSLKFVQETIGRACANNASALLVTPDAQLLVAHGCMGNLGRMSRVIQFLVRQANAQGRRVVSSWDVWGTKFDVKSERDSEPDTLNRNARPTEWPTKLVLDVLNQCRSSCGIQQRR